MDAHFQDDLVLSYTDIQIVHYCDISPRMPEYANIVLLSSKYLAKAYYRDDAADAIKATRVAANLGVRVPQVRRRIQTEDTCFLIMDRINGQPLDRIWAKLSWFTSIRLALQLRHFIHRLRLAKSSWAGSLSSGKCVSYFLDDMFGVPNGANAFEINNFLNFWINFASIRMEMSKTPAEHNTCQNPVFSTTEPFVLTHHDLAPRNMILDTDGQLWIIDWDNAGYFPPYFEYAGMNNFIAATWGIIARWRWKWFTWIAAGFYGKEAIHLSVVRSKATRFRPARRFNMRSGGYASSSRRPDTE